MYFWGFSIEKSLWRKIGSRHGLGEGHFFAVGVDFALYCEGGETVALGVAELVEISVGSRF